MAVVLQPGAGTRFHGIDADPCRAPGSTTECATRGLTKAPDQFDINEPGEEGAPTELLEIITLFLIDRFTKVKNLPPDLEERVAKARDGLGKLPHGTYFEFESSVELRGIGREVVGIPVVTELGYPKDEEPGILRFRFDVREESSPLSGAIFFNSSMPSPALMFAPSPDGGHGLSLAVDSESYVVDGEIEFLDVQRDADGELEALAVRFSTPQDRPERSTATLVYERPLK